jgi:hypothetical protein
MKYQISQSQLNSIIDKFVKNIYGEELKMYIQDDGYIFFYYGDYDVEKKGHSRIYTPYHRNLGENLWVDDLSLPKMVSNFMNFSPSESMEIVKNYFSSKYNIPIKWISDESNNEWLLDY